MVLPHHWASSLSKLLALSDLVRVVNAETPVPVHLAPHDVDLLDHTGVFVRLAISWCSINVAPQRVGPCQD